jgi:hypothetical protein
MRQQAKLKLGYYPLPPIEAKRISSWLQSPDSAASLLDPCAGTGAALSTIAPMPTCRRYGIELDAFRANEAKARFEETIHGSAFDCYAPVESFSLLYLNPPYDFEVGQGRNERMETIFLEHCFRWLRSGGVLVMVIPHDRVYGCRTVLSSHFKEKAIYRLTSPESMIYKQVVLFGIRRTRQERERLTDSAVQSSNRKLHDLTWQYEAIPPLGEVPDRMYKVPPSPPAKLEFRGLPLDQVEDSLAKSPATLQAQRVTHARRVVFSGRPLTPLHKGHVGLLCTSGLLNGIFGSGTDRHLAYWDAVKVSDRIEEEDDDGATVIREKDRFSQRLTLLYSDGRYALLSERLQGKENQDGERAPADGPAEVHPANQGPCDECQPVSQSTGGRAVDGSLL